VKNWDLVGRSENADALKEAGFDLMSVATNHIKDCGWPSCGDTSFFDTLANLERVGIPYVGAGIDHDAAMQPFVATLKGIRFGFVSLGEVTPRVFADEENPGIAELNEKNLRAAIDSLKPISDVIIVLPHSGPEDTPERTPNQYKWARVAVDAGADLVVMNHAHVIQGYQFLEGVPIFYGLGNFVFDQDWARDHAQSVILLVKFLGDKFVSFELIPTVTNERNGIVLFPDEEEEQEIIDRIMTLSEVLEE
jgi:poly-gamma-glutamate synthesis protein (capsule biosynthesis protein)